MELAFIEGKLINLRTVMKSDLDFFLEIRNSYEDSFNYRTWYPLTEKDQENYYNNLINDHIHHVVFSIIEQKNNVLIGECRISNINWQRRQGEIGICLGKQYRQKGYGREALTILCNFGFMRMGIHRLEAQMVEDNIASVKVFTSLGFIEEGILRDSVFFNGKFHNTKVMSMLFDEWIIQKSSR